MNKYKSILTIHKREETTVEKIGFRVKEDNSTMEYIENNQVHMEFK